MNNAQTGDEGTFARRLSRLIETVHPPDRGPYSYREIEAGIASHPGAMTAAYINQLARGRSTNPRMRHVEALAWFFGVPVEYFFDEATASRINEQIAEVRVWRDEEARAIAERVVELSSRDRRTVTNLIESLATYDEQPREQRQRRKTRSDDGS